MNLSPALALVPSVSDAIAAALVRHGVTLTFGQSLPSAVQLALADAGIRQYAYRTENAGSYMADGYARISRKVGVVTAQNGPAATLLVPGLAEAMKASVPVVALVQDVPMKFVGKNAFQEFDHEKLFSSCTKWVRRLDDASRAEEYVDAAFNAAASGRPGPAVLLIPMDLQVLDAVDAPPRRANLGHYPLDRVAPSPEAAREAAALLAKAERPVIVAGGGVHLSDASAELARLQEAASLPVATTVMGKGSVSEEHPLSIGVVGYIMGEGSATKALRAKITDADVVLLVGTRTNQNGTDSYTLFGRNTRFIHIDIDPMEFGRNYEAHRVLGDAKLALAAIADEIAKHDLSLRKQRRAALESEIAKAREAHARRAQSVMQSAASPLRPERVMAEVAEQITRDTIVCADASYSTAWIASYLRAPRAGMRFLTPRGLAGLGWGLPLAMGAKVAAPDATVLAVVGDGGFAHVWSELETAKRMGIHVTVVVLNNGVLGYQKDAEDCRHGRHTDACYFQPVDHAAIARACGCTGIRVERSEHLASALREGLRGNAPCVIDVVTDPMAYPPLSAFDNKLEAVRAQRAAQRRQATSEPVK
jgi:acetolactate synthase-1/2/3 large subunit